MAGKLSAFLKSWMLPIAMTAGASVYLLLHFVPSFSDAAYLRFSSRTQPILIGIMLFLQLNLVSPKDLRFHRWHLILLSIQASLFAGLGALSLTLPSGGARVMLECAMLCFICPTASAAGVITSKLGGDLAGVMTYTILSNTLASLLIPLMVPFVHPAADLGYGLLLWAIVKRVFSLLVLPLIAAWLIRYLIPSLQKWLAGFAGWAFYIWGLCLMLSISLATASLVNSGIRWTLVLGIAVVSLVCCLTQFGLGHRIGRRNSRSEEITAGQALGQKNTGFIIWLSLSYMTPVTSVAGGLYAIWHNLVNSWELAHRK